MSARATKRRLPSRKTPSTPWRPYGDFRIGRTRLTLAKAAARSLVGVFVAGALAVLRFVLHG
ncbi:MAG: hypothetical protein LBV60_20510 [Streptomyces sp.]|nr:hypothetical protein [Streptomyces sp.]